MKFLPMPAEYDVLYKEFYFYYLIDNLKKASDDGDVSPALPQCSTVSARETAEQGRGEAAADDWSRPGCEASDWRMAAHRPRLSVAAASPGGPCQPVSQWRPRLRE